MSSGIAPLEQDYKGPNTTAEGDYVLLSLQTARYLVRALDDARAGKPLAGYEHTQINPHLSLLESLLRSVQLSLTKRSTGIQRAG